MEKEFEFLDSCTIYECNRVDVYHCISDLVGGVDYNDTHLLHQLVFDSHLHSLHRYLCPSGVLLYISRRGVQAERVTLLRHTIAYWIRRSSSSLRCELAESENWDKLKQAYLVSEQLIHHFKCEWAAID